MARHPSFTWQPCGYGCGKPWRPWHGTKLIGHARCMVSLDVKLDVLRRTEASATPIRVIAGEYGVSPAVIRAWVNDALKHRQAIRVNR